MTSCKVPKRLWLHTLVHTYMYKRAQTAKTICINSLAHAKRCLCLFQNSSYLRKSAGTRKQLKSYLGLISKAGVLVKKKMGVSHIHGSEVNNPHYAICGDVFKAGLSLSLMLKKSHRLNGCWPYHKATGLSSIHGGGICYYKECSNSVLQRVWFHAMFHLL